MIELSDIVTALSDVERIAELRVTNGIQKYRLRTVATLTKLFQDKSD